MVMQGTILTHRTSSSCVMKSRQKKFFLLFRNPQETVGKSFQNRSVIIHRKKEGSSYKKVNVVKCICLYMFVYCEKLILTPQTWLQFMVPLEQKQQLLQNYIWTQITSPFSVQYELLVSVLIKTYLSHNWKLMNMVWIQLVNSWIDLISIIFLRGVQIHMSILVGPDDPSYCYKGLSRESVAWLYLETFPPRVGMS